MESKPMPRSNAYCIVILIALSLTLLLTQHDWPVRAAAAPLQQPQLLAAGDHHSCAVTSGGGVHCWGSNELAQLGNGNWISTAQPVATTGLASGVSSVTAGSYHTCALTSVGGVHCWGLNDTGQVGDGTHEWRTVPVSVVGLPSPVTALVAGGYHTCVITGNGGVLCWGDNGGGQLGDNTIISRTTPVAVSGLDSGVIALAAGDYHTCALTSAGAVQCWGYNAYGQLGDNTTTDRLIPVAVSGLTSGVTALAAGDHHTCALLTSGRVQCWGDNEFGQVGDGTNINRAKPTAVLNLNASVRVIIAGGSHTCVITDNAGAKCWGVNNAGQLGDNTTTDRNTPVDVIGLTSGVTTLANGRWHTCAALTDGNVKCWGWNGYGQLGDGVLPNRSSPVTVASLSANVEQLATGGYHTCAVLDSGATVQCWGKNEYGQLGNGKQRGSTTPVDVIGLAGSVSALATGGNHTCALLTSGGVQCWGKNENRQLGDGSLDGVQLTPRNVSGLSSGVKAIVAGDEYTCALLISGGVQCWGDNADGQLGDGTTTDHALPADVPSLTNGVSALAAGGWHTCAVTGSGVQCWGGNEYGQLGDGTTTNRVVPVAVNNLSGSISALAAGFGHTCALTSGGGVQCWGRNFAGQLGNGTNLDSLTPVAVTNLSSGVQRIAVGIYHTCALTNGGAKCWGRNDGQVGDGSTDARATPVDVIGLTNGTSAVAAGYYHTCATLAAGGAKCWGANNLGQLGDGTAWRTTPVTVVGLVVGAPTPTATSTGDTATPATATPTATSTSNTATPTPTTTPTATPPPANGDAYEIDDTCAQARSLATDGSQQIHAFHRAGDVDWVRFEAVQDTKYRIEVEIPDGSPADVNLELYADCATTLDQWHETFTPGVRLTFQAPATASFYLKLANVDAAVYGAPVTYQLSVRALTTERQVGAAIIVAGRLRGSDQLQTNIHNVTDAVFKLFQANRYTTDDIYYLATNSTLPGYDGAATVVNLQAAITTWAADRVSPERALTIYMMDHGGIGKFYLDDLNQEYVTPTQLNDWFTQLETQVPGVKINLIIEACHAGSFIRATPSLSKAGRIIVASTNVDNDAYASRFGAHFSDQFLVALGQGLNLYSSFWHARTTVNRLYSLQDPWLDADGDQIPNELEDAALAAARGFDQSGTFDNVWPPFILPVHASIPITNGRGVIDVEVRDNEAVESVWAVIYPPSYQPAQSGEELVAEALDTILLQPQANDRYRVAYTGFQEHGRYRVVIHARDAQKLEARPVVIEVHNGGQIFLPLITR